jgi:hypothetical protein
MSHKTVIVSIILTLAVSFVGLAWTERQAMDPDRGKDWWIVAFADPHGRNLDFIIENHGDQSGFSYEILEDRDTVETGTVDIPKGHSVAVRVKEQKTAPGKRTIAVWTSRQKDRKEIYKNLR